MDTTKNERGTPSEEYEEAMDENERLIALLKKEMKAHKQRQSARPEDWKMTGDMNHIRNQMVLIVSFLSKTTVESIYEKIKEKGAVPEQNELQTLTVSADTLRYLTTSLANFMQISPEFVLLNGTGGFEKAEKVTDGKLTVFVNAEGYNYPRYRSPMIANEMADKMKPSMIAALCHRKCLWRPGVVVATKDALHDMLTNPLDFMMG